MKAAKLETYSFNGAVTEAVRKCFNDSASNTQKCEVAAEYSMAPLKNSSKCMEVTDKCLMAVPPQIHP